MVVVALGLLIGLALGALGGGGSILAVPVLAHLAGQSVAAATATSLVAVAAASSVAAVGHARVGRVRWRAVVVFVVLGIPGAWLGSMANRRLDGDVLLLLFSVLVLVAAHRMLTACPSCTNEGEARAVEADRAGRSTSGAGWQLRLGSAADVRVVVAATLVGALTGLFGVGGGFVIVPALTLVLAMTMADAIGTSLAIIVGNSIVALAFRGLAAVAWDVAVPFAAAMLIGSTVGTAASARLPARRALHGFAALLVAVALANSVAAGSALLA